MKKAALLLMVLALWSAFSSPAMAQPPVCLFYGLARVDGAPVTGGTVVSAWVQGVKVAETTTADDGSYRLMVVQPEGQVFSGATVEFKIGESTARQKGVWVAGEAFNLNLDYGAPTPAPTPTPTPTATQPPPEQRGGPGFSAALIAIAAAVVAAFLTWFFVWSRRRRK
ncbi:MAG: hypothetical protein KJ624_02685 [Chloroflexi bacterium]|nr:hypothetical protein [Chloroflexota bacterium]